MTLKDQQPCKVPSHCNTNATKVHRYCLTAFSTYTCAPCIDYSIVNDACQEKCTASASQFCLAVTILPSGESFPTVLARKLLQKQDFGRSSTSNSSECKGIKRISEDSSEIVFLLVENYQLTAFVGFGRRGIFGKIHYRCWCFLRKRTLGRFSLLGAACFGDAGPRGRVELGL